MSVKLGHSGTSAMQGAGCSLVVSSPIPPASVSQKWCPRAIIHRLRGAALHVHGGWESVPAVSASSQAPVWARARGVIKLFDSMCRVTLDGTRMGDDCASKRLL